MFHHDQLRVIVGGNNALRMSQFSHNCAVLNPQVTVNSKPSSTLCSLGKRTHTNRAPPRPGVRCFHRSCHLSKMAAVRGLRPRDVRSSSRRPMGVRAGPRPMGRLRGPSQWEGSTGLGQWEGCADPANGNAARAGRWSRHRGALGLSCRFPEHRAPHQTSGPGT